MIPRETLQRFDACLGTRGLSFEAVIVGGAALGLLGVTQRQTRDCDVLAPAPLPAAIVAAAEEFALEQRSAGDDLQDDWLNAGPSRLAEVLPAGWRDRLQPVFNGRSMRLSTLGRIDLIRSKLFALCDRGMDLPDCLALAPTIEELAEIEPWLCRQDGNPGWPDHVRATLKELQRRLGIDGV